MSGDSSGRHQNRIEPDIPYRIVGVHRQPDLRRRRDSLSLPDVHRFRRLVERRPRLHLREHEQLAAPGDDVNFAEGAAPSACQNAESLRDQECGGATLGGKTDAKGGLPLRARLAPRAAVAAKLRARVRARISSLARACSCAPTALRVSLLYETKGIAGGRRDGRRVVGGPWPAGWCATVREADRWRFGARRSGRRLAQAGWSSAAGMKRRVP